MSTAQWLWMMEWCRTHKLPPGDFWGEAADAYAREIAHKGEEG